MKPNIAALAIGLLFPFATLHADHAPEWIMSTAVPETIVAGIVVGDTTVGAAERRFGRASVVTAVSQDGTETEYVWNLPLSELRATTMHPSGTTRGEQTIYAVEIRQREGRHSRARTGAGVAVGAGLDSLLRAYGSRYMTSWRKISSESLTVTFIFSNGTELSAGFSDSGSIISLLLIESQE